jgi:hypothetical protein
MEYGGGEPDGQAERVQPAATTRLFQV